MHPRCCPLVCTGLLSLALSAWPCRGLDQPAPDAPQLSAQVKNLVEQLDGAAGEDKKLAAEWQLLKLGPEALPFLPPPGKMSDNLKARLLPIQAALQELRPRTITVDRTEMPLSKALALLTKETGLTLADRRQGGSDPAVTLDFRAASFWQAVESLAAQAKANVSLYQADGKLALVDTPYRQLPLSWHGPFRIAVKRIATVRDLDAATHVCVVNLEIAWEPRLLPIFVEAGHVALHAGKDAKGQPFVAQLPSRGPVRMMGALAHEFDLMFPAPQRKTEKIDELQGNIVVTTPSKMLKLTFKKLKALDKPEAAFTQTQDGVKVALAKIVEQKDRWIVEVAIDNPKAGPRLESHQAAWWLDNNTLHLEKGAGDILKVFAPERLLERQDNVTAMGARITYHFLKKNAPDGSAGSLGDWRLVCRTPGRMVEVTVPYAFKDLQLP